jgi:hypothetical protein
VAKVSGLPTGVAVDDAGGTPRTISNDILSINVATPRGVQDVTGLDKSAMERLLLLADFTGTMNGVMNTAANMSHDVLKTVTSSGAQRTITITYPGATLTAEVVITDYQLARNQNGELVWQAPFALANGTAPAWS